MYTWGVMNTWGIINTWNCEVNRYALMLKPRLVALVLLCYTAPVCGDLQTISVSDVKIKIDGIDL